MDRSLKESGRSYSADVEESAHFLRQLLSSGELDSQQLVLASFFDYPSAKVLLDDDSETLERFPSDFESIRKWFEVLYQYGGIHIFRRVILALSHQILPKVGESSQAYKDVKEILECLEKREVFGVPMDSIHLIKLRGIRVPVYENTVKRYALESLKIMLDLCLEEDAEDLFLEFSPEFLLHAAHALRTNKWAWREPEEEQYQRVFEIVQEELIPWVLGFSDPLLERSLSYMQIDINSQVADLMREQLSIHRYLGSPRS